MNRSEEVRDFYERMPYPAPLADLDAHRDLYKNPDRRRAEFHLIWPARQPPGNLEILIAGCGTSQAARYALREPGARITAIDVSDTSLRHTRDLQRKHHLLVTLDFSWRSPCFGRRLTASSRKRAAKARSIPHMPTSTTRPRRRSPATRTRPTSTSIWRTNTPRSGCKTT